ncbi:MAG: AAA family ATPase, partial [Desulfobacterales bacterium]
ITIENFKGIKGPIRIDFKPITLLFGPNSAGKSTIVQALHYALEIFERNNLDPDRTAIGGKAVDLGGFETLVYNHDVSKSIRLKIELDLEDEDLPQYLDGYEDMGLSQFSAKQIAEIPMRAVSAAIEISIRWNHQLNRPVLFQYAVETNGAPLATIESTDDGKQVFLSKINPLNPVFLENFSPDEAQGIIKRFFEEESAVEGEFEKLGPILPALMTNFKMEKGVAGLTQPIGIAGAGTALPQWGRSLQFHGPVWADNTDRIDEGNLLMCLSALILNGIGQVVFAYEDVMGGGSRCDLTQSAPLYKNSRISIVPNILRDQSLKIFKAYFSNPAHHYLRGSLLAQYTLSQPQSPGGWRRPISRCKHF